MRIISWHFILWVYIIYTTAYAHEEESHESSKRGILGIFSKPKIPIPEFDFLPKPKIPLPGLDIFTKPKVPVAGFHVNKQFNTPLIGGSFSLGIGVGGLFGTSSGTAANVPSVHKPQPGDTWKEEDKVVGPRPNRGEEKERPLPGSYETEDESKHGNYEDSKDDSRPDWEDIGEIDHEHRSDDLMNSDLVGGGLIQPRLNRDRVKRFIDSKIYHVAFKNGFFSNARVSKVKFRRSNKHGDFDV